MNNGDEAAVFLKKIFSFAMIVFIMNIICIPAFASTDEHRPFIIDTYLVSELNLNNSKKHQIVQFKSEKSIETPQGIVIPQGTLFNGEISALKHSRFAFRRAKARIKINEMIMPDGQKYIVKGRTKRKVLKGSAAGNIVKGVICAPAALVTGAAGIVILAVETVTIIGLVFAAPTAALIGGAMGKLTNGVNCKKRIGDDIDIQITDVKLKNSGAQINQDTQIQSEQQ